MLTGFLVLFGFGFAGLLAMVPGNWFKKLFVVLVYASFIYLITGRGPDSKDIFIAYPIAFVCFSIFYGLFKDELKSPTILP